MSNAARRRIAEASLQLFNSRGYKSVTMREIAKHLGMSSKTLYAHFSSKEEIAEDVLDLLIEKIRIRTRDVLDMAAMIAGQPRLARRIAQLRAALLAHRRDWLHLRFGRNLL